MKGNELIEKILNKEIRSGALIKMTHNDGICEYCVTLTFNGNWFSEGKYNHDGVNKRHDDIILYLCDEYATFELIEEDKKIEKLETKDLFTCDDYNNIRLNFGITFSKINEIIDKINEMEDK